MLLSSQVLSEGVASKTDQITAELCGGHGGEVGRAGVVLATTDDCYASELT